MLNLLEVILRMIMISAMWIGGYFGLMIHSNLFMAVLGVVSVLLFELEFRLYTKVRNLNNFAEGEEIWK